MSFNSQLIFSFLIAAVATLAMFGSGPVVRELIDILNANVVASTAIGLPIATTTGLLIALLALQR